MTMRGGLELATALSLGSTRAAMCAKERDLPRTFGMILEGASDRHRGGVTAADLRRAREVIGDGANHCKCQAGGKSVHTLTPFILRNQCLIPLCDGQSFYPTEDKVATRIGKHWKIREHEVCRGSAASLPLRETY